MSFLVETLFVPGYEKVLKATDDASGLVALIAIHDTTLGPALGGTRIFPYPTLHDALDDVLRLSRGMTYKSAIAKTSLGGGKSVIVADPRQKTPALLRCFGKFVDSLNGQYICAEDMNCFAADIAYIAETTRYVTGIETLGGGGDPSRFTARGVFYGIQSTLCKLDGSPNVKGKRIAIQGVGNVGKKLAEFLFWEGADLVIQDVDEEKAKLVARDFEAEVVHGEEIFSVDCDVFAPCALGGIINKETIGKLRCRAVAGGANNQLLDEDKDGELLHERGILYAPDFVINAGGLINVAEEIEPAGYSSANVRKKVEGIYDQLLTIYAIAEQKNSSTAKAAYSLAEYRLQYKIGKRETPLSFASVPSF